MFRRVLDSGRDENNLINEYAMKKVDVFSYSN
jgi:hypothetical protein